MRKNTICFHVLPGIYNIQLVHGINVSHYFPRHIHSSVSFGIVERGQRVIEIHGESFTILAGECFIINPGEPHACSSSLEHSHDYRIFSVSPHVIQSIFSTITGKPEECPYFPHHVIQDQALFQMIKEFIDEVQYADDLLKQESLFLDIVTYCLSCYAQEECVLRPVAKQHQAVEVVREYLEQHFEEVIRLEDLADVAHVSPFYLNRVFQKEVGVPPYEYLVHIRIKYAQKLLKQGETIAQTAYRTGFSDQSHFTRFFKRHVGVTPGEYLRAS
jgi:AraC-like DNA-binding protein